MGLDFGYSNKYIHFDVRRSKLIAVYKKLSSYMITNSAFDNQSNCILHIRSSKRLTVFNIISRSIIYSEEINNMSRMSVLGGNKILELNEKS